MSIAIPVSVCHHVSTIGQRPPPMCSRYQIQASGLIGSPTEPSNRSELRSCFSACSRAPLHVRADRGRRRVEDVDLVSLDDRPPAVAVGIVGHALVEHAGGRVRERPVDDVAVAGHPADVGRAPVHRVGLDVEDVVVRRRDAGEVAAGRVHDPLRLRGRAARVQEVEEVLRVHRLARARRRVVALSLDEHPAPRRRGPSFISTSPPTRRQTTEVFTPGSGRAPRRRSASAAPRRPCASRRPA